MGERGGVGMEGASDAYRYAGEDKLSLGICGPLIWHVLYGMAPDNTQCHRDITAQTGQLRRGALRPLTRGYRGALRRLAWGAWARLGL